MQGDGSCTNRLYLDRNGRPARRPRRHRLTFALLGALVTLALLAAVAGLRPQTARAAGSAPFSLQQAELSAGDGAAWDNFGCSVAVSGDTAVVGAPHHAVGSNASQGAAYIFVYSGGVWTQQAELGASDGDDFGCSVAVSGDTVVVGASASDADQGAAYVFVRSGDTWSQQAELSPSDGGAFELFGSSVAIDGNTTLVGAPQEAVGSDASQGAAYVFAGSGSTWTQQAELTASDGAADDNFGRSVALSGDTALVGAPQHARGGNAYQGAAYVFSRSDSTWTRRAELSAADGAAWDTFAWSVALSADTALVGAPCAGGGNDGQGAAYVFAGSGSAWTQHAELTASDGASVDLFGWAVALSGDTALVGAPQHAVGGNDQQGAAYAFAGSGSTWTQQAELSAADGAGRDYFGRAVALSGDAALVAAPHADQGAAYVFAAEPAVSGLRPTSGPQSGGTSVTISGSGLSNASGVAFGASPAASFTVDDDATITAVSPAGSGTVDVTITTPDGSSATGAADQFTYEGSSPSPSPTPTPTSTPTTPPTTTVAGLPAHWVRHAVTLRFTATPAAGGAPVAYTEYRLASGAWTKGTSVTVKRQGATTVSYRSADTDNNLEAARSGVVRIDTTPPTLHVRPQLLVAKRGALARIWFKVSDNISTSCVVQVVVTQFGKAKTHTLGARRCGRWFAASFRFKLPSGVYSFHLVTKDWAGNVGRSGGTLRLRG